MKFWICFITVLLAMSLEVPAVAATENLVLQVGESHRFKASGSVRLEKNNSVKVKTDASSVQIIAVKPGSVSLIDGKNRKQISVLSERSMQTFTFLKGWAGQRAGLSVVVENGIVVFKGDLLIPEDWTALAEACSFCEYQSQVSYPSSMNEALRSSFEKYTHRLGVALPVLQMNPQARWLVPESKSQEGLARLASRLGIELIENPDAVVLKPMIRTQIYVMEVRRDFSRKWGIQWPTMASAQLIPGTGLVGSNLQFSAHVWENQGNARILANPTLLSRSGDEAEFLAGGEFPIKVMNYHAQGVAWKRYGIVLKVKPRADRFGRMSMSLETEISNIDPSRTVDGIPGLLTNRVVSHFDLEKSNLIALSGLIKNEESKSAEGLPGLANLPVLGGLFGSQDFKENRTELVIFVKPEVVDTNVTNVGAIND